MSDASYDRYISRGFAGVTITKRSSDVSSLLSKRVARADSGMVAEAAPDGRIGKRDLAKAVASSSTLSERDAAHVIDQLIDTIVTAVRRGQDVRLAGFGTFSIKPENKGASYSAASGARQRTGELCFTAGRTLQRAVREGRVD